MDTLDTCIHELTTMVKHFAVEDQRKSYQAMGFTLDQLLINN